MSEREQKVAAEVAESEFLRFCEAMDLDTEPKGDDEDLRSYMDCKRRIVGAIVDGRMVVDEHGQPVFSPSDGGGITFYEPDGSALLAMDQKKQNHNVAKSYAVLAAMTKQPAMRFAKMKNRDLKICQAVMALFLGS